MTLGSGAGKVNTLSPGACVVSGAGDSGYVRALSLKLGEAYMNHPDVRLSEAPKQVHINLLIE